MKNLKSAIKISSALILITVVIGMNSCKKSGVTPVASKSAVAFGVLSDNALSGLVATTNNSPKLNSITTAPLITFTSGIANITKFEFEAKRNGVERSFETRNLMNVDLFALNPALISTLIDTGTYKEIEVKIILTQSSTGAIPLTLMGSFVNAQDTIPVEFDFNQNLEIKAEANNVVVSSTQSLTTVFLLHLGMITGSITQADLTSATMTGGKIIISSTSNAALFNKVISNIGNIGDAKFKHGQNGETGDDNGGDNSGSGHDGSGHEGNGHG